MPQWAPDTCQCVFDVADDWQTGAPVKTCPIHESAPDPFVAVRNENAFKNMVIGYVLERHPGISGAFSYDDGPTAPLNVHLPNVPPEEIAALQADLDDHFGAGAVVAKAE